MKIVTTILTSFFLFFAVMANAQTTMHEMDQEPEMQKLLAADLEDIPKKQFCIILSNITKDYWKRYTENHATEAEMRRDLSGDNIRWHQIKTAYQDDIIVAVKKLQHLPRGSDWEVWERVHDVCVKNY